MIGRGDGSIVVDNRIVEVVEEVGYSVVEDIFQTEEELTEFGWDLLRIVPPEDVVNWTTVIVVS